MTNESIAHYIVISVVVGLIGNFLSAGVSLIISRRQNNLKAVARHEANFTKLQGPAWEALGVKIDLADKR